ncbi:MAG: MMPL family transporter [Candidatus Methylomirabilis sp.]|nr:MMPL family transporter [Candidatus Methylomirabilis sp.]
MGLRRVLSHTVLTYPRTTLIVAVLLTLVSVWVAITRLSFTSTHEALSALSGKVGQAQERYHRAFGDPDRVVIVVEAADKEQAERYATVLAGRLEALAEIEEVIYRFDLTSLEDHFLMYLTPEQLSDLRSKLQEHASLLKELSAEPGLNHLFQLIHREISAALVGHLFTGFLEEEDEGEVRRPVELQPLIALLTQLEAWAAAPRTYTSPWKQFMVEAEENGDREGYLWSDNKQLLFVLATVNADTASVHKFERPIQAIRREIRSLHALYPGVRAGVTGGPALEYDEITAAQRDSGLMTLISVGGVALLLVLSFRSVFQAPYGNGCAGHGRLLGLRICRRDSRPSEHVFDGVGADVDRDRDRLQDSSSDPLRGRARRRLFDSRGVGAGHRRCRFRHCSCRVDHLHSSFTLILTGISIFQELGLITGCGLLLMLVSAFVVLPPLLLLWDKRRDPHTSTVPAAASTHGRPPAGKTGETHWHFPSLPKPPDFMESWYRKPRTVLILSAAATLLALYGASRVEFDGNVLRLQAEGTESVDWELKIIRQSERSTIYGVILAEGLEEIRAKTEALEALPSVSKVESIAMVIPENQERKLLRARELKPVLAGTDLSTLPQPAPLDLDGLLDTLHRMKAKMLTTEAADKWIGAEKPPLEQMAQVRRLINRFERRLRQRGHAEVGRRLTVFQDKLFDDFYDQLSLLARAVASGPVGLDDLPNDLKKAVRGAGRFVSDSGLPTGQSVGVRFTERVCRRPEVGRSRRRRRPCERIRGHYSDEAGVPAGGNLCVNRGGGGVLAASARSPLLPPGQGPAGDRRHLDRRPDASLSGQVQPGQLDYHPADRGVRGGKRPLDHPPLPGGGGDCSAAMEHGEGCGAFVVDHHDRLQQSPHCSSSRRIQYRSFGYTWHGGRPGGLFGRITGSSHRCREAGAESGSKVRVAGFRLTAFPGS